MSDDQEVKRTATDVLLDLEKKIDTLSQVMVDLSLNIKVLSTKLSMTNKQSIKEDKKTFQISEDKKEEIIKSSRLIEEDNEPDGSRRTSRAQEFQNNSLLFNNESKTNIDNNLCHVFQKVLLSNKKAAFMASVDLFDVNKKKVNEKTMRVNGNGNWTAHLPPGPYSIKITYTDPSTKKSINSEQDIRVPDAKQFVLPTMVLNFNI